MIYLFIYFFVNFTVAGVAWAKVRAMFDHAGSPLGEAKLSEAVQIIGWRELPLAGDEILEVEDERRAHIHIKHREAENAKAQESGILEIVQKRQEEHNKVSKKKKKIFILY